MSFNVGELLRIFFKHHLSFVPIVDRNQGGDHYVLGFLSRQKVFHFAAESERLEKMMERIPDFFLEKEIPPNSLCEFFSKIPIPVYDVYAKFVENWDKEKVDFYIKNFLFSLQAPRNYQALDDVSSKEKEKFALLEKMMAFLPFPLMAMDVHFRTIFYNELYLKEILEKGPFKRTFAIAEAYFKDFLQTVLIESVMKPSHSTYLSKEWKELPYRVLVVNLTEDQEVTGYLFVFVPFLDMKKKQKEPLLQQIEEKLNSGKSYDEIIEELENQVIEYYLKKNQGNISHTAKELRIKRTTLQHKIKRLKIENQNPPQEIKEIKETQEIQEKRETSQTPRVATKENYKNSLTKKRRKKIQPDDN